MAVKLAYRICEELMNKITHDLTTGSTTVAEDTDSKPVISDELKAIRKRSIRNAKLDASDWTQMPDYNGSDKTTWATYRQDLRDVPQQETFPTTVTWPEEPGA